MAEWTHRVCERCWFDGTSFLRPPGENDDGTFRMPTQVKDIDVGVCCSCGGLVVTGIFMRQDENKMMCKGQHDEPGKWSRVRIAPVD